MDAMMDFPAGRFVVTLISMLFDTGARDEDGRAIVADCWRVWVTNGAGRRWQMDGGFSGYVESDEFGCGLVGESEARDQALGVARAVALRLQQGAKLDADEFREVDPAYGSHVYQTEGGDAAMVAWEKAAA